jgi:hypothetical protein
MVAALVVWWLPQRQAGDKSPFELENEARTMAD